MLFKDNGVLLAKTDFISLNQKKKLKNEIRFRTIGDATCTGATISNAYNIEKIIEEVSASKNYRKR